MIDHFKILLISIKNNNDKVKVYEYIITQTDCDNMFASDYISDAKYILAGVPQRMYNNKYGWCTGLEMWGNTYFLLRLGTADCIGQKFYIYYL